MAEFQCPVCGQQNPDHLKICQHCQADLSAGLSGAGETPGESPAELEGSDLADWLLSLRQEEGEDAIEDEPDYPEDEEEEIPLAPDQPSGADGIPDWLAALSDEAPQAADEQPEERPTEPSPTGPPDVLAGAEEPPAESLPEAIPETDSPEGPPAWLTDLAEGEDSVEISGSSMQVTDLPDWVEGLVSGAGQLKAPAPIPDPEPDSETSGAGTDWLAGLRGEEGLEDLPVSDSPAGDMPDWLEGVEAIDEEVESTSMPAVDPDDGDQTVFAADDEALDPSTPQVPDWIAQLANQDPDPRESLDSSAGISEVAPDWLEQLDSMAGESDPEPEPDARSEEAGDPASLFSTPSEPEAVVQPGSGEGIPDWLDDLQDQTPPIYGEIKPGGDWQGEDVPDWLQQPAEASDLPAEDLPLEEDFPQAELPAPADSQQEQEEMPDWLSGLTAEADGDGIEAGQAEEEAEALPDWLESLDEGTLQAESAAEAEESDEIPDWLAGFEQPEEAAVPEEQEDEDLPDWLTTLEPAADQPAETAEQPTASLAESDEFPSALEAAAGAQADETVAGQEEAEGIPDWLSNLQEQVPSLEQQESGAPDTQDWDLDLPEGEEQPEAEVPDWLPSGASSEAGDPLPAFSESPDEIAPGEVPDWLQAMRPEDAVPARAAPQVSDAPEQYGPLAGMRGLLSAEPAVERAGKPEAYSVKLRISDAQQSSMEALRAMVEAETEPQPAGRKSLFTEQGILRWIIVTLLFLVVIFPFFLDLPVSGLPPMAPPMGSLGRLINELPAGTPALVIMDFEPGMSAEMNAAAGAILDHLMLRETPLALVSSSPLGPALGERLVSRELGQHGYTYGQDYVNLGYIPGGATGLQNFANFPRASLPLGYDGLPFWRLLDIESANPWAQVPLQNVRTLSDFGLTLLVTDNPDTTRSWIEQVQPKLKPGTFVVIASAQAEPLILPYYNSGEGQVTALVTGVAGGAAYEAFLTREGPGRAYWDSLGLGALAAIVLLFGAGSLNLFLYYRQLEAERKGRR